MPTPNLDDESFCSESSLTPSVVDIKRLMKVKQDRELRLKMLQNRVNRLNNQEEGVWKQVARTQQRTSKTLDMQRQVQAEKEQLRQERELLAQDEVLRDRAREIRLRSINSHTLRQLKFEENKAVGKQVREESQRMMSVLTGYKQQALQSKAMHVDVCRQHRTQQKLRAELNERRREQARQDMNALKFAELQEQILNADLDIDEAEQEELEALRRLQNSQSVQSEVLDRCAALSPALVRTSVSPSRCVADMHGSPAESRSSPRGAYRRSFQASASPRGLGQINEDVRRRSPRFSSRALSP